MAKNTPPEYRYILSLISLFEGNFSIDWIERITGKKASQIISLLERGIREGFLENKGEGEYCFIDGEKLQQWQEILDKTEKTRLHTQITDFLIRELQDDVKKSRILIPHLLNIPLDIEKASWLLRAGDEDLKAFQIDRALECYYKILEDMDGIKGEEADRIFLKAAIKYSRISTARHNTKKVLFLLKKALRRAVRAKKIDSQALLEMQIAKSEWLLSNYNNAIKHFRNGSSLSESLSIANVSRSVNIFRSFLLYWQGYFEDAIKSYEMHVPTIEEFPKDRFPLLSLQTLGHCYTMVGQITHGMGLIDGIRVHSKKRGDIYSESHALCAMGGTMLDIRRVDDALNYLYLSLEKAEESKNDWIYILVNLMLAYSFYLQEDFGNSLSYLQEFCRHSDKAEVKAQNFPYLIDLLWAMQKDIHNLSIDKEVERFKKSGSVFMRGLAYRYQALMQRKGNFSSGQIFRSLNTSLKLLNKSGHKIEIAKSHFELALQYLSSGKNKSAENETRIGCNILPPFGFTQSIIPDDLRVFVKSEHRGDKLLEEILKLGQETINIRKVKDLVTYIISTVNRVIQAERGAIFLFENTAAQKIQIIGSRNLTEEQISHPGFGPSLKMIKEVARTGKANIFESKSNGDATYCNGVIRSCVCVPMVLRDKVLGVLYHDNRLINNAFKKSDLKLLQYFASQAAIALDNATAWEQINKINIKLQEEKQYLEEKSIQSLHFENIIGESQGIKNVLSQVNKVAKTDAPVLIFGETGVGKELIASAIHRYSIRNSKPLIRVHCNALPESLIPSELFGHEKGAFTGATSKRIGRFELARNGTIFLDEIGDLPQEVQIRLLRVLQFKEFERVGGTHTINADFRLIAATNRNLKEEVASKRFRSDLYYRINVFPIYIPPLRDRKEDIPLLAHYFLKIYSDRIGKIFRGITEEQMEKLLNYDWPGNIRELENIIERGVILSSEPDFYVPELDVEFRGAVSEESPITLEENERKHILRALNRTKWKISGPGGAAELLKIHPNTLSFRMKKLGIRKNFDSSGTKKEVLIRNFQHRN